MNELVKKYLDERNKAIEEENRKKREKRLISLGLYTEEKVYADPKIEYANNEYPHYDKETNSYYGFKKTAVEVSDEEYEQILKVIPPKEKTVDPDISPDKESSLKGWGTFLVVLGFIDLVAGIIVAVVEEELMFALVGISLLFTCLILGAFLKVIVNVSVRVDEISRNISKN